ncbi:MAG TPA: purine-nucleoside phosphorylase [Gemmatimonadaceae bacterium]|nr:purine-nucleoside phosphorylase [Gemmatimonadaceae bacterium]
MTVSTRSAFGREAAANAAATIRNRVGTERPVVGLVLGSGLARLADRFEDVTRVEYRDIPGFPVPTVAGHPGVLIAGTLAGRPAVALAGRFHMYEGHDATLAGFPARVFAALGAEVLFVSNAAGGIRRTFRPGDLMVIADHVNLTGRNPLIGPVEPGDLRFPDMSGPYDPELRAALHRAGKRTGVMLVEGVYGWALGPSYETPAEVRMFERFGLDAVGMSTVPEVITARAMGLRVAGVSCVTNLACGITNSPLDHEEVLAVSKQAAGRFESLVFEWVRDLA